MLFDGEDACTETPSEFFHNNLFYRATENDFTRAWGACEHPSKSYVALCRRNSCPAGTPCRFVDMRILADRTIGVAHAAGGLRCTGGILLRVRGGKTRPAPNHAHGNPWGHWQQPGRILFAPIPDFKPVSAICIIAGAVFGKHSGFMVGALAALCSNFFFGQGTVDALADVCLGIGRIRCRRNWQTTAYLR